MKLAIGQKAPDICMTDLHGDTTTLSSQWEFGSVLLYFHRHLGSIFSKQAFRRLDCSSGQLESHGVRIISIVPTNASNACAFCIEGDFWHTCLSDAKLYGYQAYGIPKASPTQIFGVKPLRSTLYAMKHGYKQSGRLIGNALVMSAAIVVDELGIVRATRYSHHIGDIPSVVTLKNLADQASRKLQTTEL